jgi:hypothetical protein
MKRNFSALLLLLLLFAGCKKEHGEAPDTTPPVVKIISPANNQVFALGQTIAISASVSDQSKLEEIHLEITNANTGVFFTHEHYVTDSSSYQLTSSFTPPAPAVYKIRVEGDDSKGNSSEVEVNVTVR